MTGPTVDHIRLVVFKHSSFPSSAIRRYLHLLVGDDSVTLIRAVLIRDDDKVVRAEGVDFNLSEFAGGDLVLKEDIEISVGKTLRGGLVFMN